MNFDVQGHLGAVERSVSSLERDGQPARAVILSREYATTVEDLWDAWGEAAIAAGADPEGARAAARRTTGFYTGEPVENLSG